MIISRDIIMLIGLGEVWESAAVAALLGVGWCGVSAAVAALLEKSAVVVSAPIIQGCGMIVS